MAKLTTICPVCENDISIASRDIKLAVMAIWLSSATNQEVAANHCPGGSTWSAMGSTPRSTST